jgi:hypothetical protein
MLELVARGLQRTAEGVASGMLVLAAAACGGPARAGLSGVEIDTQQGTIGLITGCYDRVGGDAELRDGQIVVTDLWGKGPIDGDCATSVPLDLAPGPDPLRAR